jgi:hypothetical protein
MAESYQLSRSGKIIGEHDLETLHEMRSEGLLQPADHLWAKGWPEWQLAYAYLDATPAPRRNQAQARKPVRRKKKPATEDTTIAEDTTEEATPVSAEGGPSWDRIGPVIGIVILALLILFSSRSAHYARRMEPRPPAPPIVSQTPPQTTPVVRAQPKAKPAPPPMRTEAKAPSPVRNYGFTGFGYDGKDLFASSALAYAGVMPDEDEDEDADAPKDAAPFYSEGLAQLGVALSGVRKGDRFRITVSGDRFIKPSSFEFTAETDDSFVEAGPHTLFDYEALSRLKQSVPFNVSYTVQRGNEQPRSSSETWIAHQVNDCQTSAANLYLSTQGRIKAKPLATTYSFAGYVNENHPLIDGLLKEALNTGHCSAFSGYQNGDEGVYRQVNAIWAALQRRRISYSNIATSTVSGNNAYQHVRFIDETMTAAQANCIDGSVVLASMLRKIGLNVSIILTPGHAYVAVRKDDDSEFLFGIETTMIGTAGLAQAVEHATVRGPVAINKILDKLGATEHPQYQEINLRIAREIGVQPIPYTR